MNFDWQDILALAVVLAATVYLVERALGRKATSCSACGGCQADAEAKTLITIQPLAVSPLSLIHI